MREKVNLQSWELELEVRKELEDQHLSSEGTSFEKCKEG